MDTKACRAMKALHLDEKYSGIFLAGFLFGVCPEAYPNQSALAELGGLIKEEFIAKEEVPE
jgi:hypothetical protein